jgi:RHS repeat-associated protein
LDSAALARRGGMMAKGFRRLVVAGALALLLPSDPAIAKYFGADPPCHDCPPCESCATSSPASGSGLRLSLTQGNLSETYRGPRVSNGHGTLLHFDLNYQSYNADYSRARFDTVAGVGWTHTYNVFVYEVRGHLFRSDAAGRLTKFQLGSGATYTAAPGYFDSLRRNPAGDPNGAITITDKHGNKSHFGQVTGTPFSLGAPLYRLLSLEDRNGNRTTLTYAAGLLTEVASFGRKLSFAYHSTTKKLRSVTDPRGFAHQLSYDSTGTRLATITDPLNRKINYSYNVQYQLTRKTDRDGRVFNVNYANGRPVGLRDQAGANIVQLSNPNNWATDENVLALQLTRVYLPSVTTLTDGRGNRWKYSYDANAYVTQVVAPDNAAQTVQYSPQTLLPTRITDANGRATQYEYDALGNKTKEIDHHANETRFSYEPVFNMPVSMLDANARATTYGYDARGNRVSETDPLLQTMFWAYDARGLITGEFDRRGHTASHEYDAVGDRIATVDRDGQRWQMSYDASGNLVKAIDPREHVSEYVYDSLNRRISDIDATGRVTATEYDGSGNRTKLTDRNGRITRFEYDSRQRLARITDALPAPNNVTRFGYDANDNRVTVIDKNNNSTQFVYDVQNRLTRVTDAEANSSSAAYDPAGNPVSVTDANNHTTQFQYDALNRMVRRIDALGHVTHFVYDAPASTLCIECTGPTRGSPAVTAQIDATGKLTYFAYDALDRRVRQLRKVGDTSFSQDADDALSRFEYDPNGNLIRQTEANGDRTAYDYDALDRRIEERVTVDPLDSSKDDVTRWGYDADGLLDHIELPNGNRIVHQYDALHRLVRSDDNIGALASYAYEHEGNLTERRDGNGHGPSYVYDAIYRVVEVIDALGNRTIHEYDPAGNLLVTRDREERVTRYEYDRINRRVKSTDPQLFDVTFHYDRAGNLIEIRAFNDTEDPLDPPQRTSYAYDAVNRRVAESLPDRADGRPNSRSFSYDGVGNLISRRDQLEQMTTYVYDDLHHLRQRIYSSPHAALIPGDRFDYDLSGRMVRACRAGPIDAVPADDCDGWLVQLAYDGAGRILRSEQDNKVLDFVHDIPGRRRDISYPSGRRITELADARARPSRVEDIALGVPITEYSYDLGNRVTRRAHINGTHTEYRYDANNWTSAVEHFRGATRLAGFEHEYDREGNKRFERKQHEPTRSEAYAYNDAYRLVDFRVGELVGASVPVPLTQTQYQLDLVGNWKSNNAEAREHNAANEVTAITGAALRHDDNGNLAEDARYHFTYDVENRLVAMTRKSDGKEIARYVYDALSRRVAKITDAAVGVPSPRETRYYYDDARIVEAQDPAGASHATFVYGAELDDVLHMRRGGADYYYHQNALGSVIAVSDAAGVAVERYTYDAYGQPTITSGAGAPIATNPWGTARSAVDNPWLFSGRQFDEESGLFFYRMRYLDPVLGRFISRDPIAYVDGFNLYEYAASNPGKFVDPFGLTLRIGSETVTADLPLYKKLNTDAFTKELLDKMINSKHNYSYRDAAHFSNNAEMRKKFAECMKKHSGASGGMRYREAGESIGGPKSSGWKSSSTKGAPEHFEYQGKDPSKALDDLEKGPTRLECHTLTKFCLWKARRDTMGAEKFNAAYAGSRIDIGTAGPDFKEMFGSGPDILPGDWVYFKNVGDYLTQHPGQPWQGENTVYEGDEQYTGFGVSSRTAEEMRETLLRKYNAGLPLNLQRTIEDIPQPVRR